MINLEDGCTRAKQNSKAAENNYKRTLDQMNKTIDYFHANMKPVLRKVQESDLDQTDFLKFNLEKFSGIVEQTGIEV